MPARHSVARTLITTLQCGYHGFRYTGRAMSGHWLCLRIPLKTSSAFYISYILLDLSFFRGQISEVFKCPGDVPLSDVLSWVQSEYLRRDGKTNYHYLSHQGDYLTCDEKTNLSLPLIPQYVFTGITHLTTKTLLKIPQHGHFYQAFQQCPQRNPTLHPKQC